MVMHDLVRSKPMGDVDIFVATRAWFDLYQEYVEYNPFKEKDRWNLFTTDPNDFKRRCDPPYLFFDAYGIEVNIFCEWRKRGIGDLDVNWLILNAKDVRASRAIAFSSFLTGRGRWVEQRILMTYEFLSNTKRQEVSECS